MDPHPTILEFDFVCPLRHGLHARPARRLAQLASEFESSLQLRNDRSGSKANLKSVLAIISAGVFHDDHCVVTAGGPDAEAALAAVREFVVETLPGLDDALEADHPHREAAVPRPVAEADAQFVTGQRVCGGIGQGTIVRIAAFPVHLPNRETDNGFSSTDELQCFADAVAGVDRSIHGRLSAPASELEHDILRAHLSMLHDIEFAQAVEETITTGELAARAVWQTGEQFATRLRSSGNQYFQERAGDIDEICLQLLSEMGCATREASVPVLGEPSVVVAETLSSHQLLALDRQWLRGLVLERVGPTSHVALLIRSMGIPCVTAVKLTSRPLTNRTAVIVDGDAGLVVSDINAALRRYYDRAADLHRRRRDRLRDKSAGTCQTCDGINVHVEMNVASPAECSEDAVAVADGVGLLRTELVFGQRDTAPSEQDQLDVYGSFLQRFAGEPCESNAKPITIRMFDIGADKSVPFMPLPAEENPALGRRGIRIFKAFPDLFKNQLRAILRVAASGPVRLMFPMVTCVEEVQWLCEQVRSTSDELLQENHKCDAAIQVGIMVEVPSIVFVLEEVCPLVDFLSIGTNDLSQYLTAADRGHPEVAELANVIQPAFLRHLQQIAEVATRHNTPLSMCGDMASRYECLPILVGLGIRRLSVAGPEVSRLKAGIRSLSAGACRTVAGKALACATRAEVETLLKQSPAASGESQLLEPEFISIDVDCQSQAEVIAHLAGELFVHGRSEDPPALQQAIWGREAKSSTALGHGFAVPHCKSSAVLANSIAVARLRTPVPWTTTEDLPVSFVILMAMQNDDTQNKHLRVFSSLARKLMQDEFRAALISAADARAVFAVLQQGVIPAA